MSDDTPKDLSQDFPLDGRKGLPEHLRVLADLYPRTEWRGHPNFNDLTSFWLERHGMFRQLNDLLVESSEKRLDGANPRYGRELQHYTSMYLNQLHGHHQIEDQHYFPQFIPLDRRLEQGFEILDRDHHALDGHIHALAASTNAVLQKIASGENDEKEARALLDAQKAFRAFLHRHLEDEEDLVVPVILEYGAALS
ncbi:MAG: hemerythrin domain-containing protein [Pseudomonadota bacterium]|nr:hemerythrin domain-containing protein [Pseudomonadota bacterium]MEC8669265.1 hemerythrin domain-containing protein [Pseudomonadota bacterium]